MAGERRPEGTRSLRAAAVATASCTTLLMVAGMGGLHWAWRAEEARAAAVVHGREVIATAYELAYIASRAEKDRGLYRLTGEPRALAAYQQAGEDYRRMSDVLADLVSASPEQAGRVARARLLFAQVLRGGVAELLAPIGPVSDAQRLGVRTEMEQMAAVEALLRQVVGAEQASVAQSARMSAQVMRYLDMAAALATLLLILISVAGIFFLSRQVLTPLAELTALAQAISRGEFQRRVPVRRRNEIGSLADSFNRMAGQLDQQYRQDQMLRELRELMHGVQDQEEAWRILALLVPECLPHTAGRVCLLGDHGDVLVPRGGWGEAAGAAPFAVGDCWAYRLGRVHEVSRARHSVPCAHHRDLSRDALCIPLEARGALIGVLEVTFEGETPRGVIEIAETLSVALANVRLQEEMRAEAQRDALTGAFNRGYLDRTLRDQVEHAARQGGRMALALVDVDHFKRYNDQHGHAAGDAVLRELAATLRRTSRGRDTVCRYGGEEFVVLLLDCGLEEGVHKAEALRAAVRAMHVVSDGVLLEPVTISVGVAAFPEHGPHPEGFLAAADRALYRSKAEGRDRVSRAE